MIDECFLEYYELIYNFINDELLPKYDDLVSFSMHTFSSNEEFAMNFEYIFKYKFTEKSLKLIESKNYDKIMNVFNIDSRLYIIDTPLFYVLERSITNDISQFYSKIDLDPAMFYVFDLVILVEDD